MNHGTPFKEERLPSLPSPEVSARPAASALRLDLRDFFLGPQDYAILRLSENFPNYADYSDIDILCGNPLTFLRHILAVGEAYEARGYTIRVEPLGCQLHVDFYPPGATRLSLRFDLIDNFTEFHKFTVTPEYAAEVLARRKRVERGGVSVFVPQEVDDLALRILEFVEHDPERPSKRKHLDYVKRAGNLAFVERVERFTDLSVLVECASDGGPSFQFARRSRQTAASQESAATKSLLQNCRSRREEVLIPSKSEPPHVGRHEVLKSSSESPYYQLSPTCQIPGLHRLYEQVFGQRANGTFIEVGAFDGDYVSNTSGLADLGWTGHYIEPVPSHAERCRQRHARNAKVQVTQAAIGAGPGRVTLHVGGPLSTANPAMRLQFETLAWAKGHFDTGETVTAEQTTLDAFLAARSVEPGFEVLVVDVEGQEWPVFQGFDIARWQPQMVIVELHDQNPDYRPFHEECRQIVRYFEAHRYFPIFKDGTNTVFVSREKLQSLRERMDYFLIWGHGLAHAEDILKLIRRRRDLEIISIHRKHVGEMAGFVQDIYACDTVPYEHLRDKTRYLLSTPQEVLFILVRNLNSQERIYGDGPFRHIQCALIKDLKEEVRNAFNPRSEGRRTEHHVIHASDYESQVRHVLKVLGLPDLAHYQRQPSAEVNAPYHLDSLEGGQVRTLEVASLDAHILGRGLVPIDDTPHFAYVRGNKTAYSAYYQAHSGELLTDDHAETAFDELIQHLDYGRRGRNGRRDLIVVRRGEQGRYVILDGVHRAAVLRHRGLAWAEAVVADPEPSAQPPARPRTALIVFSKDRPLQLEATLASLQRCCPDLAGAAQTTVLYTTSAPKWERLYDIARREHPEVCFVRETSFRADVLRLAAEAEHVFFLVDDNIFIREFRLGDITAALEQNADALGFSLRLGRNTTFCYSFDTPQTLPPFQTLSAHVLKFDWRKAEHDFGYPLELSSSIYRTAEVLPLLRALDFRNPNSLETVLADNKQRCQTLGGLLCFDISVTFCAPINRVQQVCPTNRAGTRPDHSAESLAGRYERGERLDVAAYAGFTPQACHQEVELRFRQLLPGSPAASTAPVMVHRLLPAYVAPARKQRWEQGIQEEVAFWDEYLQTRGNGSWEKEFAFRLQPEAPLQEHVTRWIEAAEGATVRILDVGAGPLSFLGKRWDGHTVELTAVDALGDHYAGLLRRHGVTPPVPTQRADAEELTVRFPVNHFDAVHARNCIDHSYEAPQAIDQMLAVVKPGGCVLLEHGLREGSTQNGQGFHQWDFFAADGEFIIEDRAGRRVNISRRYAGLAEVCCQVVPEKRWISVRLRKLVPTVMKNHRPLVSVVIPCYNQAQYLPEAVASVVGQTFRDLELIVVNDGSPDNTLAVATELAAQHQDLHLVVLTQPNGGLAEARNAGIRAARGRYILPLDADDAIEPEFLAKTVACLDANPDVPIVGTCRRDFGHVEQVVTGSDYTLAMLLQSNRVNYCALYRREIWQAVGGYDPNMICQGYEDWDFWISCAERGWFARFIPEPLFRYRVKPVSMFTDAQDRDAALRAQIVLKHAGSYGPREVEAARRVLDETPAAPQPAATATPASKPAETPSQTGGAVDASTVDWKAAEDQARAVLAEDPNRLDALNLLAAAALHRREWLTAAEACNRIVQQQPNAVVPVLILGKCFFHLGDSKTAREAYELALRLDPGNDVAQEALAIIANGTQAATPSPVQEERGEAAAPAPALSVPPPLTPDQQKQLDRIPCPFCGGADAYAFRDTADIVRCARCDTVFLRTRHKTEILEEIYQTYADDGSHMALPKTLEQAAASNLMRDYFLKEILQFTRPTGRILDVGCGWGAFLLNARAHGFEPSGLELTRKAVRYANDELRIPVVNTQFLDTPYDAASLQVVTMNHVLEHLPQPREALDKVFRTLKPGGLFCGIVPNVDSFCSTTEREQWFWLDPNYHYVHYSPATLRKHLEAAGFKVERLYTTKGDYGLQQIRDAAVAVHPELRDEAAFSAWLQRIEADGHGEEIRFFARKPALTPDIPSPQPETNPKPEIRNVLEAQKPDCSFPLSTAETALFAELRAAAAAIEQLDWPAAVAHYQRALESAQDNAPLTQALRDAITRLSDLIERSQAPTPSDVSRVTSPGVSFCVITHGKRPEQLRRLLASICALNLPQYEILVGGEPPADLEGVTLVPVPDAARHGRLGEMRNRLTERARFDTLVVADDDLVFLPDFAAGLDRFGNDFDVQCVRFLNPDGTRYWDWATNDGPRGHALLPYDQTDPHVYVTGGLCIMKAGVARRVQWDEGRGFYQGEDADFSRRLHAAGLRIQFNPHCTVVHHDPRCTQLENVILSAEGLRQTATDALKEKRLAAAAGAYARLQLFRPSEAPLFEHVCLAPFTAKRDGRYVFLSDELLPAQADADLNAQSLIATAQSLGDLLQHIGPFYAHFGGAGDALLLLATFLDQHPNATVVSYPNSVGAAKAFFDAFPSIHRVIFLPPRESAKIHVMLRMLMRRLPNCRGSGVTPETDYFKEWHAGLDIFKTYGVNPRPAWPVQFRQTVRDRQVVLAPRGSMTGMVGTKRNIIDPKIWPDLLTLLRDAGLQPVILGTPDERADYPCPEGCTDCRSFSFAEQMQHIAESALFVGADSWGKSFAALAGLPTLVFEPIKRADWLGKKDASDHVFLEPWPTITVVKDLDECRAALARLGNLKSQISNLKSVSVSWHGPFDNSGSLALVNRELSRELERLPGVRVRRAGFSSSNRSDSLDSSDGPPLPITLRHAWPPNWEPAERGPLVVIQPWEFGALPEQWVRKAKRVDEFWVPSNYVRQLYLDSGVLADKVFVVPNGIDPDCFRPDTTALALPTLKKFKFLFVGGTIHRKGPDLLLAAYLKTFTAADDVCLVIKDFGGDGVYAGQTLSEQIRAAQARPDAPEILHLTEALPPGALPGLYTACDCLVHPYRGEGFGLPVLEAMACGLSVIVTSGGAADDFASNGFVLHLPAARHSIGREVAGMKLARDGWLLEPDPAALARQMQWAFTHRDEARALGQHASEHARRNWTWEHAARIAASRLQHLAGRAQDTAVATSPLKPTAVPAVAKLGDLANARALFGEKKLAEAWTATLAALEVRPFHPEAFLLLAEIALAAGDSAASRRCAERARQLAPEWKAAKEFLKSNQKSEVRGQKSERAGTPVALTPSLPHSPALPRLTVCLITKNEERFVGPCLDSVRRLAHQIVVVDTGSTDRTAEIAKARGAEVHTFAWCDDFSAARNAALEHARGDWVLVLDADEELPAASGEKLLKDLRKTDVMAYRLPIVDAGLEDDGGNYVPRLFRNAPGLFFAGRVHEHAFGSIEARRAEWGLDNRLGTATLLHYGYTTELTQRRHKNERNLRLLERALEESTRDPNLLMNHGLELVRSGDLMGGLDQYLAAYRLLAALPTAQVSPELREALLTQLCTHLMAVRNFDGILSILDSPLAKAGGLTASMHFVAGLSLVQLGRPADALKHFEQCLAKRHQSTLTPVSREVRGAGPRHGLALCLTHLRQASAAKIEFQKALKEDPRSRPVRMDYARFLRSQGALVEALQTLHGLISDNSGDLEAWHLGGEIALSRLDFQEFALDWTGEALRYHGKDPVVVAQRAEVLMLARDYAGAASLLKQLSRPQPREQALEILCAVLAGETNFAPPPDETQVSRTLVDWYQRLFKLGAAALLDDINGAVAEIGRVLPTAARCLSLALEEALQS
ncbi:MAG: FkbM family methyltransferase [Verrucomicrobia bacterium]|nr:FkbM family methyltransferase [Verrucomicrobiota bacterium]